ncbi:hypothetical protein [Mycobacterium hubeiense]|uniref:hypothetical protein n=1 Tax=Mycobacterium hubeiense TaxID=1867256 RepID=UPI000C7EAED2|nr:hypothetical protein [Mycobacterium sp. QGD 101]
MNAPQKIAGFVLGLVVVFAAAVGLGAAVGPDRGNVAVEPKDTSARAASADLPDGLTSTKNGYTLELAETRVDAGPQVPLRFRIIGPNGVAVTNYVESHEKQLHLIVVRRDMVGYQHVHPTLDASGTWSVPLDLSRAGDYRVFADFTPAGGQALTLGADLDVAGRYDPRPLPAAATTATVDGYTVRINAHPRANEESELTLSITRNGKPVSDLQPYLGAYGHLVALRASDLAYLHVHPMGEPGDGTTPAGPDIGFHTTFPSGGGYRLFLEFKHDDVVRTAEFTVSVDDAQPVDQAPATGHGH